MLMCCMLLWVLLKSAWQRKLQGRACGSMHSTAHTASLLKPRPVRVPCLTLHPDHAARGFLCWHSSVAGCIAHMFDGAEV